MQVTNVPRTANTAGHAEAEAAQHRSHSPGLETSYDQFVGSTENVLVERFFRSRSSAAEQLHQQQLKHQFAAVARRQEQFHDLMVTAFGDHYDRAAAEDLRQCVLRGDYRWLPRVELVDGDVLGGANGAYDAASGTVLLNRDLQGDAALMSQTFVEEAGHHLDTLLNTSDSVGDEGEVFRRLLLGENLSASALAAIRAENDHGTIVVNGESVAVEFWNPFKAVAKAVSSAAETVRDAVAGGPSAVFDVVSGAADAVSKAASTVVDAGSAVVRSVGSAIARSGAGVWETAHDQLGDIWEELTFAGSSLWDMTSGVLGSLFRRDVGGAWESLRSGADNLVLRLPGRVLNDVLDTSAGLLKSAVELIPAERVRDIVGDQVTRATDAVHTLTMGLYDASVGALRNMGELAGNIGHGLGLLLRGEVEGFSEIGTGLLKIPQTVVDTAIMVGGKAVSAVQTVVHLEPPGRELTGAEINALRAVFGNSIDYDQVRVKEGSSGLFSTNDRPFVHGNTIYLKDDDSGRTLVHEMTHIWQHQNGGTDYMTEAIVSQWGGEAYDWARSLPDTSFGHLAPEQQAAFVEEAWLQGAFTRNPPCFPPSCTPPGVMRLSELNDYLLDAVAHLRAGRGAP